MRPRSDAINPPRVSTPSWDSSSSRTSAACLELLDAHRPVEQLRAIGLERAVVNDRDIVSRTIADWADQCLKEILERDDAGRAAVLVDDHGDGAPGPAHVFEQVGQHVVSGIRSGGAKDRTQVEGLARRLPVSEQFADTEMPMTLSSESSIDGQPAMTRRLGDR